MKLMCGCQIITVTSFGLCRILKKNTTFSVFKYNYIEHEWKLENEKSSYINTSFS